MSQIGNILEYAYLISHFYRVFDLVRIMLPRPSGSIMQLRPSLTRNPATYIDLTASPTVTKPSLFICTQRHHGGRRSRLAMEINQSKTEWLVES